MNSQIRMRSLAVGLGALLMAAGPGMALAQPYGPGPYGPAGPYGPPAADPRSVYDAQYGPGAYDRYMADQQARAQYACHQQQQGNEVGGALLGGLAGAVIGSNVTRGGGREGGAIIGGVAGAAAGSTIAAGQTNCN